MAGKKRAAKKRAPAPQKGAAKQKKQQKKKKNPLLPPPAAQGEVPEKKKKKKKSAGKKGPAKRVAARSVAAKQAPVVETAPLDVPGDLAAAIAADDLAVARWSGFARSHRDEYVRWVNEAKRKPTREARIESAVKLIAGRAEHKMH